MLLLVPSLQHRPKQKQARNSYKKHAHNSKYVEAHLVDQSWKEEVQEKTTTFASVNPVFLHFAFMYFAFFAFCKRQSSFFASCTFAFYFFCILKRQSRSAWMKLECLFSWVKIELYIFQSIQLGWHSQVERWRPESNTSCEPLLMHISHKWFFFFSWLYTCSWLVTIFRMHILWILNRSYLLTYILRPDIHTNATNIEFDRWWLLVWLVNSAYLKVSAS